MKQLLVPLLTLLPLATAIPPHRRIPDILVQIKQQQQQQQQQRQQHEQLKRNEPQLELQLAQQQQDDASTDDKDSDVETNYFDQRLDHFSTKDIDGSKDDGIRVTFFKQRYFYSSRYVHKEEGSATNNNAAANNSNSNKVVAFLCVGGEGPSMDASVLVDSVHCTGDMIELAKKLYGEGGYDVHLYALEHRYYGESFPTQEEKSAHLLRGNAIEGEDDVKVDYAYLSSRQAVADIANFVTSITTTDSNSQSNEKMQWITFGGSYPGMLSAWSHLLHPSAIRAAVSSSAPIQAKLDFSEYNEHVGNDLQKKEVGGSKLCHDIVREGHAQVVAVLDGKVVETDGGGVETTVEDVDDVAALFNVCGGGDTLRESKRNQEAFVGDGLIRIPAQGNDPSCVGEFCNIQGLCDAIVNERKSKPNQSSMEILATIGKLQSGNKDSCNSIEWKAYLDWLEVPTKQNANDRSWLYQTCNEFGFYQTCNIDSTCPYGRGYHNVSQDLEMCKEVFGIAPDTVKSNVRSTLTYYGGRTLTPNTGGKIGPNGEANESGSIVVGGMEDVKEDTQAGQKRILFVTGDVDPWTELSLTKGNSDHPSISVQGASHHFWTHKVKDTDSDHIVKAREDIHVTVIGWLDASSYVPSSDGEAVALDIE